MAFLLRPDGDGQDHGGLFGQFGGIAGERDDEPGLAQIERCGVIGGGSKVTVPVTIGECMRVRVGGYLGATGNGYVLVDCVPSCAGDLDNNGVVNAADLGILLGGWNTSTPGPDIDNNGVVDAADLAILLGNWGPC